MKKSIFLLVALIFGLTSMAQEHLSFKGISIEGSMESFCEKLADKGFTELGNDGNTTLFTGDFTGRNATIGVISDDEGGAEALFRCGGENGSRGEIRILREGIALLFAGSGFVEFFKIGIVHIEDRVLTAAEERFFARLVIVEIGVLGTADMVLGEIGHDRGKEGNAVDTVELHSLRGDLDDSVPHTLFHHFGKDAEKLVAFGSGVARGGQRVADPNTDRADRCGGNAVFREDVSDRFADGHGK